MTTINSKALYRSLESALDWANEKLSQLDPSASVSFIVYAGKSWNNKPQRLYFSICNNAFGMKKVEVEGIDFEACVEEFLRRLGFQEGQANLALGAPQIEEQSTDDEIPF